MFGVKSLLMLEKVLLMRNDLVDGRVVLTTDATIAAVDFLMQSDRCVMGKCWMIPWKIKR